MKGYKSNWVLILVFNNSPYQNKLMLKDILLNKSEFIIFDLYKRKVYILTCG